MTKIERPTPETWRDFPDILTDSLWLFPERDRSGGHTAEYHGNFIPQISNQLIRRFTSPGDVILDPFLGSGTTLIEARRLGRHGIGIELNEWSVRFAEDRIAREGNPYNCWYEIVHGDALDAEVQSIVSNVLRERVPALIILHPPYHDIIKFSDDPRDLSNCKTVGEFLNNIGSLTWKLRKFLSDDGFMALVMGDKYEKGSWIPLGFQTMQRVRLQGWNLKSIIVKDIQGNRAKRNLGNLWRYRAFKGNFYIFKHEYIFLFQKVKET